MNREKRPPHPATVRVEREAHPGTVQPKAAPFGMPKVLPPHAATVQRKAAPFGLVVERPPHPSRVAQRSQAVPTNTKLLSVINTRWGICGFASSLAALYENNAEARKTLDSALGKGHFETRLLAEIKTYLNTLKAAESPLIEEIVNFTRTFSGFEQFSLDTFIGNINKVVVQGIPNALGIAMTANAVADYLRRMWDWNNTRVVLGDGSGVDNIILGLCDNNDELKHWVYKKDANHVFNWGEDKTLAAVLQDCRRLGFGKIAFYVQPGW